MKKTMQASAFRKLATTLIILAGSFYSMAQDAAPAAAAIKEEMPVVDTRTIAEWSAFSGTQIFTLLMLIMIVQIAVLFALSDVIKNLLKSDKFKDRFKNKGIKTWLLLIGCSFLGNTVSAAAPSPEANSIIQLSDSMFWALVTVNIVLLLVILYLVGFMKWVLREMNPQPEKEIIRETWWNKIMVKMTDAVPVEKENAVLTDHEYDGIRELDNNLPPWWVWGFYVSIAFAFVYLMHFHVFKTGDLQAAEYEKEMITAKAEVEAYLKSQANNVDEFNAVALTDPADLSEGKTIFDANCATCHKTDAGGQTGPNLTDDYWIHGGDIKDIFKTVKYGVPAKSMPIWSDKLTPVQMQRVASYVKSLRGTHPAGAKGPEGDLYIEDEKSVEDTAAKEVAADTLTTGADTLKK